MRKSVTKQYPKFDEPEFYSNEGSQYFGKRWLDNVPNRFGRVYHARSMASDEENFILFEGDCGFNEDARHCLQDKWFMYDAEPVVINHRNQMRGNLPDGDVDFYVKGPITLPGGSYTNCPTYGRPMRYPYRIASYLPIRNVLVVKNLFNYEPTPSINRMIAWMFNIIEGIGYKYNEKGEALLIGCDPEFNIHDMMDERIYANTLFSTDPEAKIGCDGHAQTGELRPSPANCPVELTRNISDLLHEIASDFGNDKKLTTGGGGDVDPLGHHIHFNKMLSSDEIQLLDEFVGGPALGIKGAKRLGGDYEVLGQQAVRRQPHGCEYRTPASSLIPELAAGLHTTAYCAVKMWEDLPDGQDFVWDTDDNTGIPTLDSYLSLDTSEDGRYKPFIEEFWKWACGIGGRRIDPKQDCLFRWVPGRSEVKPKPGIKVSWSANIFDDEKKPRFLEVSSLDKIFDMTVFILPTTDDTQGNVLQVCLDPEEKAKVDMQKLVQLKTKHGIERIIGFDHPTRKLGLTKELVEHIGSFTKLKKFVVDFSKAICVDA